MLAAFYEECKKLEKLLNDKTEQVKNLLHLIDDLERELKGEKELRKKSQEYIEEYLENNINRKDNEGKNG